MEDFLQFIGRFHPLWVHLPIGILLVAVLFDWLSGRERFQQLKAAVSLLYFLGAIAAVFSCLTGYLLSRSGDYAGATLVQHQWLGISTAILAFVVYFLKIKNHLSEGRSAKLTATLLFILVSMTGHLGGSLTHGADYLYVYMPQPFKSWFIGKEEAKPIITNVQEALVYEDIIVPILKESCYKCHSTQKQKGKLRLDSPDFIAAGGKTEAVLINTKTPEASEILRRIHLPLRDDEHMPPNEKDELSKAEKALLSWWIEQGAGYESPVKALEQEAEIQVYLMALENPSPGSEETQQVSIYPEIDIPTADPGAVQALRDLRAVVIPIAHNSPFLSVNLINVDPIDAAALEALSAISKQVVWLKLSDSDFNDEQMAVIAQMQYLSKLYLDQTSVTDEGLAQLQGLEHLKYLNLVGTKVSKSGLETLEKLPALAQLFIFQTATTAQERAALLQTWPKVQIDTGGYQVPTLATDTISAFQ